MSTLLAATKRRDDALAALKSAKGEKATKKAEDELSAASLALAKIQAKLEAKGALRAEDDSDEEEEEEEESEEEDDEPKKPMEDKDSDDDSDEEEEDEESEDEEEDDSDDDDDGDDDDDDDDEEEEEDAKARASALASARAIVKSAKKSKSAEAVKVARSNLKALKAVIAPKAAAKHKALLAACQRVTGKKSLRSIVGALDALATTAKSTEKLSADVKRIKAGQRRERVSAMIADARKAGKVTPAQVDALRAKGIEDPKWLKAYLGTLPKQARLTEEGGRQGKTLEGATDADQTRAEQLDAQKMPKEQRDYLTQSAAAVGKSFDDYVAEMNKRSASLVIGGNNGSRS